MRPHTILVELLRVMQKQKEGLLTRGAARAVIDSLSRRKQ